MISASDIKLLESEVMADTTDGGGRKTSRVIVDGVSGNIFPKISRIDSVYGRTNLRKVYGGVLTANQDTYAGAHVIITDAPDNDKIHCTLFSTASDFDNRTSARDRIESFVTTGPESRLVIYGKQLKGQETVQALQRVEEPLPEIGEVFCITEEAANTAVLQYQQYVRVSTVESEIREFEDDKGNFTRRVVTLGLGSPLRYDFSGSDNQYRYLYWTTQRLSKIRTTTVVDAARYYGIQKLAQPCTAGVLSVQVQSVYSQLVPTTTRENAIANESLVQASVLAESGPARTQSLNVSYSPSTNITFALATAVAPGTLSLTYGAVVGTDDGAGSIIAGTGSQTAVGTIDYSSGVVSIKTNYAGATNCTYVPAAALSLMQHTISKTVDLNSRGTVYVFTAVPLPAPGAVAVDYRALGKWYRLRDNGAGKMSGADAAYGAGTVDYETGTVTVTLGALPDVGSYVILYWGSPVSTVQRLSAYAVPQMELQLGDTQVARGSISVEHYVSGVKKIATDDSNGNLKVGATVVGKVKYNAGTITMTAPPDADSIITVTYDKGAGLSHTFTDPARNGDATVTCQLPTAPVIPLSVHIEWNTDIETYDLSERPAPQRKDPVFIAEDDGLGNLKLANGNTVGTVNYSTGIMTFMPDQTSTFPALKYAWVNVGGGIERYQFIGFVYLPAGCIAPPTFDVVVTWRTTDSPTAVTKEFDPNYTFRALGQYTDDLVEGSLLFSFNSKTYYDNNGVLYMDRNPSTGAGTACGTVDYSTSKVVIKKWGAASAMNMQSCLGVYGQHTTNEVTFRAPGNPIRIGSFYVSVTDLDGVVHTCYANDDGSINSDKIYGKIDYEMGVVNLKFGSLVTAAGQEAQPWYRVEDINAGFIWKPVEVIPDTLRYNCVVISNLPLNADIIGLDPVRLPSDGRVPIFRQADVVVVHHTDQLQLPNTVLPSNSYGLGVTDLTEIWIVDQYNRKLSTNMYEVNLETGVITTGSSFSMGSLIGPLIAKYRFEDMALLTDVQINGQLTFSAPLTRSFPANSFVSSALLFGDMNARVTNVHDLYNFAGWTDTPGSGASAQFNNIDYPILVVNEGAVNERWRINFTSTNTFQIIGENLGVIEVSTGSFTGSTAANCAPVNKLTGKPYFQIAAAGWGSGWAAGNQLRFNTISASSPIWIARTVLPGATLQGDSFSMQMRGDVDVTI